MKNTGHHRRHGANGHRLSAGAHHPDDCRENGPGTPERRCAEQPQVPDRTAYILDRAKPSPCRCWRAWPTPWKPGLRVLCAPCVTSHYFYQELAGCVKVPFLHMVEETAFRLRAAGKRNGPGFTATTGTVRPGSFRGLWRSRAWGGPCPASTSWELIMSLIYEDIKAPSGASPIWGKFQRASEELFSTRAATASSWAAPSSLW